MDISLFDYDLPQELIAQSPADQRDHSRLLVVNKKDKTYEDKMFYDIVDYLHEGDVLVRNNTKVIPSRLLGYKETGAHCELLLLNESKEEKDVWDCLARPGKAIRPGTKIIFGDGKLVATCIARKEGGIKSFKFDYDGVFMEILEELGHMPLPPYIKKQNENNDRYQTVYAKEEGSAAAPTAGFHFTDETFEQLRAKGVEILDITLTIGLGTFKPVSETDVDKHVMHSEEYEITQDVADALNKAKDEHRRIIAVGTTSVRTLEANMTKYGKITATRESTDIFIKPGYTWKIIDCMITNFHLPKSTLIMLVSSFMGREFTLECYQHAINEKYRFFSFGDAMFIHE